MKRRVGSWIVPLLVLALAVTVTGCWGTDEAEPAPAGDIEFTEPEETPTPVADWVDDMRDPLRDWMIANDDVYVAIARGEVPNPGYGVVIENLTYKRSSRDESAYTITVSASYTAPEPGVDYPQVPSFPVALVRFPLDALPGATPSGLTFDFLVDESEDVAAVDHPTHTLTLFFGTPDGEMTKVYRTIKAPELNPDLVAAELMIGPVEAGAQRLLPEGTTITAAADPEDPTLGLVDFSPEILEVRGTLGEMLAIYSVVNSFIENDLGFDRIQVSVDGETRELGHLDISDPLTYDDALLLEDK